MEVSFYRNPDTDIRYLITGPIKISNDNEVQIYCLTKGINGKPILVYADREKKTFTGNDINIPFSWEIN